MSLAVASAATAGPTALNSGRGVNSPSVKLTPCQIGLWLYVLDAYAPARVLRQRATSASVSEYEECRISSSRHGRPEGGSGGITPSILILDLCSRICAMYAAISSSGVTPSRPLAPISVAFW